MLKDIEYKYGEGSAVCIIKYNGYDFVGRADCHPDDEDFESERVGLTIAESRANIKVLRHIRNCEIKPQLKILKHLFNLHLFIKRYLPLFQFQLFQLRIPRVNPTHRVLVEVKRV